MCSDRHFFPESIHLQFESVGIATVLTMSHRLQGFALMSRPVSLVVTAAALALFSSMASANPAPQGCRDSSPIIGWIDKFFDITPTCGGSGGGKPPMTAPEIDPASTISAAGLLLGGLLVLRGRKARI